MPLKQSDLTGDDDDGEGGGEIIEGFPDQLLGDILVVAAQVTK